MVKAEKNYKIRFLKMPPKFQNPRIWELARFHPDFILVMFLMLMHERFFAQIGGTQFRISDSPNFPQLLTIMSDTQAFPFFSRGHILRMLACHGATLHLVRALCRPMICIKRKTPHMFMDLIGRRVFFRIASNPVVVSCFEKCSRALFAYPLFIPESPIRVEICDKDIVSSVDTIWQMLSLCTILPDAKAILDISSENLSASQMIRYNKLYIIIIFRRLFESQNRVFILLCKYFHVSENYKRQRRSDACLQILRERLEQQLELQMASHDFEVYCYYLSYLYTIVLEDYEQTQSFVEDSMNILKNFSCIMSQVNYITQNERKSGFFGAQVLTCNLFRLLVLLQEENQATLLEQLGDVHIIAQTRTLVFCASPPVHSSPGWLFPLLQNANSLNLPREFLKCLENIISDMEDGLTCKNKMVNQFARLLVLVFNFAEWSQSDHPHRHFISECVSWMKETGRTKHTDLARFLNLQKFQSEDSSGFCRLLTYFRKFAQSSMGCSEPTERTLLCFFEQMRMVFSNETFLRMVQEFLETLEKERVSCELHNAQTPRFQNFFSDVAKHNFCVFLRKLDENPQLQCMIQDISYFRHTNCADCRVFLDHDNDDGLCDDCKSIRLLEHQIKMCEDRERRYSRFV